MKTTRTLMALALLAAAAAGTPAAYARWSTDEAALTSSGMTLLGAPGVDVTGELARIAAAVPPQRSAATLGAVKAAAAAHGLTWVSHTTTAPGSYPQPAGLTETRWQVTFTAAGTPTVAVGALLGDLASAARPVYATAVSLRDGTAVVDLLAYSRWSS
jgi:hypothetical protein